MEEKYRFWIRKELRKAVYEKALGNMMIVVDQNNQLVG